MWKFNLKTSFVDWCPCRPESWDDQKVIKSFIELVISAICFFCSPSWPSGCWSRSATTAGIEISMPGTRCWPWTISCCQCSAFNTIFSRSSHPLRGSVPDWFTSSILGQTVFVITTLIQQCSSALHSWSRALQRNAYMSPPPSVRRRASPFQGDFLPGSGPCLALLALWNM